MSYGPMQIGRYSGRAGRKSEKKARRKWVRQQWKQKGENCMNPKAFFGYED